MHGIKKVHPRMQLYAQIRVSYRQEYKTAAGSLGLTLRAVLLVFAQTLFHIFHLDFDGLGADGDLMQRNQQG